MSRDVREILRREEHLNLLSYVIILALMAVAGVLLFAVVTDAEAPRGWLLGNNTFTWVFTAFLFSVIAYMAVTHGQLRREIARNHEALERARAQVQDACDRLSFAHRSAEIMTSLATDDGLDRMLAVSAGYFAAGAAAVVDRGVTMFAEDGVDRLEAEAAVMEASMDALRGGAPIASLLTDGAAAMCVPLRIKGRLQAVLCLWRHGEPFTHDQLDGLTLVARMVELGLENRVLFSDLEARLEGTLEALVTLVDLRQPEYAHHSLSVADRAADVASAMGLSPAATEELRLAGMLLDVGMLKVPDEILTANRALSAEELELVRQHPRSGADLAQTAHFGPVVQEAIYAHHERLDGSGYPRGLRAEDVPIAARILGVCDVFDSMISPRAYRPSLPVETAIAELLRGAGKLYDPRVVNAFLHVSGFGAAAASLPLDDEPVGATA